MRLLTLLVFVLLHQISFSQNCDSLVQTNTDKFTGKTSKISARSIKVSTDINGALISLLEYSGGQQVLLINVVDNKFGCTDESGRIYFIFQSGLKFECKNNTSFNCSGENEVWLNKMFGNKKLQNLLKKEVISSIKVQGRKGVYETDVSMKDAEGFRDAAKCLLN